MRRSSYALAGLAALALALAPATADARAGDGASMGSRGSRSFVAPPSTSTAPYAAPLQRSMSVPMPPTYSQPAYGQPAYSGRSSFMSGLMGGFLGAGLAGMLFGHGMFGGIDGFGSFFWFLIQMALLFLLARFLWRRFRGPQPFLAGLGNAGRMMNFNGMRPSQPSPRSGSGGGNQTLVLAPPDYQAFDAALQDIQAAWTSHDLSALRGLVTPEMLSYFAEQLADQASRGVRNSVTDVRLIKGDLSEAWTEGARGFATVAMRFSMIDVTRDTSGRIVDGSPTEHVTATEFWTFSRVAGGHWLLSAIQQAK